MSTMNSEIHSVARRDGDIAEIKASLLLLRWMVGFTLAFAVAITWRVFG